MSGFASALDDFALRPAPLISVPVAMSWGREDWHGSTQEGQGQARVRLDDGREVPLREVLRARPELAGRWTRALFGDGVLPLFTKFLRTNFAPFVHFGFATEVDRAELTGWLRTEQALMRRLLASVVLGNAADAATFLRTYAAWATSQSLGAPEGGGRTERWESGAMDGELVAATERFLQPGVTSSDLTVVLGEIRQNRARYCATVNLVDLREETGNLLLAPAGVPHAINGLSEQTHPQDAAAEPLRRLFVRLAELGGAGAGEHEMLKAIADAGLSEARRHNTRAPKSEAWLPVVVNGELVLIEPQQTSNVTYSYADFTTPFVWNEARGALAFRKGDPATGLSDAELATFVDAIQLSPLDPARARRVPIEVELAGGGASGARLHRLVDEPWSWPFFTAYVVDLEAGATFRGVRPEGAFQSVLALRGPVELGHVRLDRALRLSPDTTAAAMVWATADAPYTLTAAGPAQVLLTTIPTPARVTPAGGAAPSMPSSPTG